MKTYTDINHDSNVESYEIRGNSIIVKFKSGSTQFYEYTTFSAGSSDIAQMEILAEQGDGLNAYININKPDYARKW